VDVSARRYHVVLHRDDEEGVWWLTVPALPGCFTQGSSVEETLERAGEAIAGHLETLQELGQSAPLEGAVMVGEVEIGPRAG
jgi:antitoxin HicB